MIDRYTEAVLTVIAVCLCLITAQNFNFIQSAEASDQNIQRVAVCNWDGKSCALVKYGQLSVYDSSGN